MPTLPADRIAKMGAGGAVGGLITFIALNPTIAQSEQAGRTGISLEDAVGQMLTQALLFGGVLGLAAGGALVATEELLSGSIPRLARRLPLSLVVGGLAGACGGLVAQIVYVVILGIGAVGSGGMLALPLQMVARAAGWCLAGASAGICPGAASGSWRRVWQGVVGGAVGGGMGGLLFDALAAPSSSGTLSRAVGLVITGLAIGVAVSLVEEFGKRFWLTGLTGPREGRSYILAKPRTVLGRDELADIPVFGDPSVQRHHAVIAVTPTQATIASSPGTAATVNRQPVSSALLSDGDVVGIGRHLFRFNARYAVGPLPNSIAPEARMPQTYRPPAGGPSPDPSGVYAPPAGPPLAAPAPGAAPTPALGLHAASGPHAGQRFVVPSGGAAGREAACAVLLDRDMRVSRRHAQFVLGPAGWQVEDLGSSNGLWVNGARVAAQTLSPGDRLGLGDTELLVS